MTYQETPKLAKHEFTTSILVLGTGWTGLRTASLLADLGYATVLAGEDSQLPAARDSVRLYQDLPADLEEEMRRTLERVRSHPGIERLTGTRLLDVKGMPGNFLAVLGRNGTTLEREIGSIVLATDISVKPLFAAYGLERSERVLSLSDLEKSLKDRKQDSLPGQGTTSAFLVGFAQEGNPLIMHRVMQNVEALEARGCEVFVYVNNIKVAAEGLEKLYKSNRDKGSIFFKLRERPAVSQKDMSITSFDSTLGKDIQLNPDLIVVEEELLANPVNPELADVLHLDLGPWNFLQEDNVHRLPVQSNREGIFVAGEARETMEIPGIWTDAANVALQVKDFLADGQVMVPEFKAVIDKEKCCFCLTCYRCCPHGAISWDDKPFISPIACQTCGICASECPQNAIQIVEYTDDAVKAEISAALQELQATKEPKILAFCCENSAFEAWSMAESLGRPLPQGLKTIKIPCAGKVDMDYISTSFLQGADGVAVMTCHPSNCKSVRGNTFAGWRVDQVRKMLQHAGLEPDRLLFHTLASNMDHDFAAALNDLKKRLSNLGPTPLGS